MARIRRAPRIVRKLKSVKQKAPLHQRILGKGAVEIDNIDDYRIELEKAYDLHLIEYDVYLDCHEALDIREEKAKIAIQKACGRYVKPQKVIDIPVRVVRRSHSKPWAPWQIKLMIGIVVFFLYKMFSFKP